MTEISQCTRKIREIENLFIPLNDGCRLAARIWLPEDAEESPVPAILEYLPYRKRDGTADRDEKNHPYIAAQGYACIRVDMRGNGESDGLMLDEYLKQEQDDALEVIEWIARQPWCTGKLGMIGISWGGFNGLQVAARQPEALKAIVTACSTDDRYTDDVHYKGGCMLVENIGWAATMFNFSSKAPDPLLVGGQWRDMWLDRLQNMPLLAKNWIEHTYKDDYWKHGSINEDYSQVKAAVYAVGGWNDSYSNTIPRMMEKLQCPRKGLIGPWAHRYPNMGQPGPAIGFLQECLRWWDYWLKDIDNGIMDEPQITVYIQDSVKPHSSYLTRPGRWVQEQGWPTENTSMQHWYFSDAELSLKPQNNKQAALKSPLTMGSACGEWCIIWMGPEFPTDQRYDDAGSLCFDTPLLDEEVTILGAPVVKLELQVDKPFGQLVVRINDVDPDGNSTRVTYGMLNLKLRDGSDRPMDVPVEQPLQITLKLDDMGYCFPRGHRIRVAVSNAYFPLIWPTPESTTMRLNLSNCSLQLPIHNQASVVDNPFEAPVIMPAAAKTVLRPISNERAVSTDLVSGRVTTTIVDDFGETLFEDHGLRTGQQLKEVYSILPDDALSARAECYWNHTASRGDWSTSVDSSIIVTCDARHFFIEAEQIAYENGQQVHRKVWHETLDRGVI
ncbi:MAG: CocE/NonD family hydrolase [Amphritea sp.]